MCEAMYLGKPILMVPAHIEQDCMNLFLNLEGFFYVLFSGSYLSAHTKQNLSIDCMPSLGMMTINALVSSDSVLIPVQAAYLPVKGEEYDQSLNQTMSDFQLRQPAYIPVR